MSSSKKNCGPFFNSIPTTRHSIALRSIAGSIITSLSVALQADSRYHYYKAIWSALPIYRVYSYSAIHSAFDALRKKRAVTAIRFICPFHFRCNQRGGAKLSNGVTMGNFGWVFLRDNIDYK